MFFVFFLFLIKMWLQTYIFCLVLGIWVDKELLYYYVSKTIYMKDVSVKGWSVKNLRCLCLYILILFNMPSQCCQREPMIQIASKIL